TTSAACGAVGITGICAPADRHRSGCRLLKPQPFHRILSPRLRSYSFFTTHGSFREWLGEQLPDSALLPARATLLDHDRAFFCRKTSSRVGPCGSCLGLRLSAESSCA